jgi:hypothetical protein
MGPYSATKTIALIGAVGSKTVTSSLSLTVALSNPGFAPASGKINLPIININTNGVAVTSTETNIPGTVSITSADGSKMYLPGTAGTDNTGTFHVHGNTTASMPKLAYHLKLNSSTDLLTQMGLACPYVTSSGKSVCDKSKSYVLLANYDDKTMLRDWSAYALANSIPIGGSYLDQTPLPSSAAGSIPTPSGDSRKLPWAPHSLFAELFLNGVYEGTYQLVEQVKVDSHRVNIPELAETQTNGDLTGGYLLEIDQHQDEAFVFKTPKGLPIGLIDPDFSPDPQIPEQTSYINQYVNTAETALFSRAFTDPTQGWRAYFDEASAVNYYLVNDIMGNVDGGDFYSSVYLYKSADNPYLYMGPVWDFDISSGNVNYEPILNPTVPWVQTEAIWYAQWFKDPAFKADVIKQFNALKSNGVLSSWLTSVSNQAGTLQQAQANNFARWPMLGIRVWPNAEAGNSYDDEVSYLLNYLNLRIAYLDSTFNGKAKTGATLTLPGAPYYQGTSETFTVHVTGGSSPAGSVSFFAGQALLGSASLDGTGLATLTTQKLPLGTYNVSAVYNGDDANALSATTATSITVVAPPSATEVNLSSSTTSAATGVSVALSVSVIGNGTAPALPSGTVTFTANGSTLGTATLSNGVASLSTTVLSAGSNTIAALYSGDSSHQASSSNQVQVTVAAAPTVKVSFATNPSGLTFSLDGAPYTAATTLDLQPGSTHSLSTASPQSLGTSQEVWTSWSDGGAQTHNITVGSAAASYMANFTVAGSTAPSGINFSGGFAAGSVTLNGSAQLNGSKLRLTNGSANQVASAFYPSPVNVQAFTSDFTFQLTSASADGFMFVLQNQGPSALGAFGMDLGYRGITKSLGIKFDLYNNSGEGANSTGLYTGGARPTTPSTDLTPSGINLHSGNPFKVHLTYNGTTLMVTLTDTVTNKSASQSYTVDLPTILGSNSAYAGFTAGTGTSAAVQDVLNWTLDPQ